MQPRKLKNREYQFTDHLHYMLILLH